MSLGARRRRHLHRVHRDADPPLPSERIVAGPGGADPGPAGERLVRSSRHPAAPLARPATAMTASDIPCRSRRSAAESIRLALEVDGPGGGPVTVENVELAVAYYGQQYRGVPPRGARRRDPPVPHTRDRHAEPAAARLPGAGAASLGRMAVGAARQPCVPPHRPGRDARAPGLCSPAGPDVATTVSSRGRSACIPWSPGSRAETAKALNWPTRLSTTPPPHCIEHRCWPGRSCGTWPTSATATEPMPRSPRRARRWRPTPSARSPAATGSTAPNWSCSSPKHTFALGDPVPAGDHATQALQAHEPGTIGLGRGLRHPRGQRGPPRPA